MSRVGRKHPVHGVLRIPGESCIVFLTVCTKDRQPWLAQHHVQKALQFIWTAADAWQVGEYVLMPDHLHLFCAPHDDRFTLHQWVRFWKHEFTSLRLTACGRWHRDYWDTRLRHHEHLAAKWHYVRQNPVRKGLVTDASDWPFQGRIFSLHG